MSFKVLTDPTTRTAALKSGDIDLMESSNAKDVASLGDQFTVIKNWETEPGVILTNTIPEVNGKPNPLHDIHARRALAPATDRKALAAIVGAGVGSGTSPFASDGPWGQPPNQDGHLDFDLASAKKEVASYKSDTGASSLSIQLIGVADSDTLQRLQALQSQWARAGITVQIKTVESAQLITQVIGGGFQAVNFPIYSAGDPDQNFYFWSKSTANGTNGISINFTQFSNDATERDLRTGRTSPDHATRKAAYDDLVEQINHAAVNIWTADTPYSLVANKAVRGLQGAAEVPFANFDPKTWLAGMWVSR